MTWKQIKEAVEEVGLEEDDEISLIKCENGSGTGTFHKMRLGQAVKLIEDTLEKPEDFSGCAT
jgi:ABC-type antimicrobial peptide transport system ATPase subunit